MDKIEYLNKVKTIIEYIDRVNLAIKNANDDTTKLTNVELTIPGMSSRKNKILLNSLLDNKSRYLEIGSYFGSTYVAANYKNNPSYSLAIDNFSEFVGDDDEVAKVIGQPSAEALKINCERSGVKFNFINNDCFSLTSDQLSSIKDINVYLYDGGHKEKEQVQALTYYKDCLEDIFILIVDDWNDERARVGTRTGFKLNNITVHKEWELFSRVNGDKDTWWNGFYVAVCEK
jgi:hypothetical protein